MQGYVVYRDLLGAEVIFRGFFLLFLSHFFSFFFFLSLFLSLSRFHSVSLLLLSVSLSIYVCLPFFLFLYLYLSLPLFSLVLLPSLSLCSYVLVWSFINELFNTYDINYTIYIHYIKL